MTYAVFYLFPGRRCHGQRRGREDRISTVYDPDESDSQKTSRGLCIEMIGVWEAKARDQEHERTDMILLEKLYCAFECTDW